MLSQNLDLTFVEKRLIDKNNWSFDEAKEAVRRYKNFLALLYKHPNEILAPAPDMDEAWHAHILFTKKYMEWTTQIFGEYLHHTPSQESDSKEVMTNVQLQTAELYLKEFGESYFLELNVAEFW